MKFEQREFWESGSKYVVGNSRLDSWVLLSVFSHFSADKREADPAANVSKDPQFLWAGSEPFSSVSAPAEAIGSGVFCIVQGLEKTDRQ